MNLWSSKSSGNKIPGNLLKILNCKFEKGLTQVRHTLVDQSSTKKGGTNFKTVLKTRAGWKGSFKYRPPSFAEGISRKVFAHLPGSFLRGELGKQGVKS